jgi:hypothetical protein
MLSYLTSPKINYLMKRSIFATAFAALFFVSLFPNLVSAQSGAEKIVRTFQEKAKKSDTISPTIFTVSDPLAQTFSVYITDSTTPRKVEYRYDDKNRLRLLIMPKEGSVFIRVTDYDPDKGTWLRQREMTFGKNKTTFFTNEKVAAKTLHTFLDDAVNFLNNGTPTPYSSSQ